MVPATPLIPQQNPSSRYETEFPSGTRYARARTATVRRDLIAMPARTARHGRGNLILHLPAGHHREHAWQNLWTDACGPPAKAA
jgi:hypothetical protein